MENQQVERRLTTDVLVVGGGPAGLSAAIALRQKGIDCVVVEALSPAIDKACGEGLMPDTLATLAMRMSRLADCPTQWEPSC